MPTLPNPQFSNVPSSISQNGGHKPPEGGEVAPSAINNILKDFGHTLNDSFSINSKNGSHQDLLRSHQDLLRSPLPDRGTPAPHPPPFCRLTSEVYRYLKKLTLWPERDTLPRRRHKGTEPPPAPWHPSRGAGRGATGGRASRRPPTFFHESSQILENEHDFFSTFFRQNGRKD